MVGIYRVSEVDKRKGVIVARHVSLSGAIRDAKRRGDGMYVIADSVGPVGALVTLPPECLAVGMASELVQGGDAGERTVALSGLNARLLRAVLSQPGRSAHELASELAVEPPRVLQALCRLRRQGKVRSDNAVHGVRPLRWSVG